MLKQTHSPDFHFRDDNNEIDWRKRAKFGRDNLAADVPEGTHGVFILTAKETAAKL